MEELLFFRQAPSSILESLETHMNGLEDAKGGKKGWVNMSSFTFFL